MAVNFVLKSDLKVGFIVSEGIQGLSVEEANTIAMIQLAESNDRIGYQLFRLNQVLHAVHGIDEDPGVSEYFSCMSE